MKDLKFMLELIAATVYTKNYPEIPEQIDWEFIRDISIKHNVANIIAYGIAENNYDVPEIVKNEFSQILFSASMVCENQIYEIEGIFSEFEKNKVEYAPLKGVVLRDIYPNPSLRMMADADILIHTEDFEIINRIMLDLGYEFKTESNHEYIYSKPPFFNVELHKYLIPTYNDDMHTYYKNSWKMLSKNTDSYRCDLSVEDHYVYIITHFAKHYRDSGIGIKPLIDMWLYTKKYIDNLDMDSVRKKLKELNLNIFFENISRLIDVWFEKKEHNYTTEEIEKFILKNSVFGIKENSVLSSFLRDNQGRNLEKASKFRYINAMFPSYNHMTKIYPFLKKIPVLLPACWMIRLLKRFFYGKSINEYKKLVDISRNDNVNLFDEHMKLVGLDIYNGRIIK